MMTEDQAAVRVLKLFTDRPFTHTGSHLRGALLAQFPDRQRLHNHSSDGKPKPSEVRYLVREQVPCVIGLGKGRADLLDVYEAVTELTTPNRRYRVRGKELLERPLPIGPVAGLRTYSFSTPWLALNQQNHEKFRRARSPDEQRRLLEGILVGNVLTAARAAGVDFPREPRIEARIVRWSHRPIEVVGQELIGFRATLVTNLAWSPWVGLGKMASKGFGLLEEEN